ncbi:MAG TPA: pilus assembly protein TadG-related protein [Bradyrhizobium sp.]|jgi:Flp pilus assembly protein TadG
MTAGRITALIARFRSDTRANIAVIFAIATVPILTAVGCATDYSMAARMKSKMQSSADSAAVASVSANGAGWAAAMQMTSNGSVAAGVTEANNVFNGNAATYSGYQNLSANSTVTKTGSTLNSVVNFSADVPVTFMRIAGWTTMHVTGRSSASASLPLYLDFYLMLDVSSSMGLPSTTAEAVRMQNINPDNYVQYPTGCTLACHFQPQNSACKDPPVTPPAAPASNPPTNSNYTQRYNTNNYCMGYIYSRLSQSSLSALISQASTPSVPKQVPGLPVAMLSHLNNTVTSGSSNSLITGNVNSLPYSLPAVANCPTDGTDACIQLRLDAVGSAVNALFATANDPSYQKVTGQFRIGLYPYITSLYSTYFPLTSSINGSATNSSTINYAAANLASLLDTNMNSNLGSGGTNQDAALSSMNTLITSVGNGSASNNTLPYVFIVTDGAVTPQTKGVPNGSWGGSNHDTTIPIPDTNCTTMKSRGITISILNIPFQPISPVNASFAGDEDDAANTNIPNIEPSLKACASPGFYYKASTPNAISQALQDMFKHALVTAHITN